MEEKIHIKGTFIESDTKAVAIVGSRQMTDYGKMVAWKFAYELAKRDITIVSGLAKGVDTVAHTAALKAGGRTIAVLGSGINTIYPVENTRLSEVIVQHGALMSLFADDAPPAPKNFLERNKLIAQLSLCTIVIEGKRRSGTLSTAAHTANLGKEVFAIPGRIDSELSEAPHWLLKNGATVVTEPEEIIKYIESIEI